MKKLNAFQLKFFALVIMLLDHLWFAFPKVFPVWFHPLSRFVAPLFAFFLVEGLFHTRNKLKYNIRLAGWAVFMMLGNSIINMLLISKNVSVSNNIFATLALGLTIINLLEYSKKCEGNKKMGIIILSILLIPGALFVEGGMNLIPFIIITYLFRGNNKKLLIGYILLFIIMFKMNLVIYPTLDVTIDMLMYNSDFLFITAVPFMLLYNGERGLNNKFSKYMFYVFYPLHLWGLAVIKFIIN